MDLLHAISLFAAGTFGGALATLVGGAALITFPALLAVGLSPIVATATNLAAMPPNGLAAAYADFEKLPPLNAAFFRLIVCSTIGALGGALLLLYTPNYVFEKLIPILLALATGLFAYGGRIGGWMRARAMARHGREPRVDAWSILILLPVSIYIGYFGAGAGVMLLAIFSIWTNGDYRAANVTKNLVSGISGLGAACLLTVQGSVNWPAALLLMAGALIGGFVGARIARIIPNRVMHVTVVSFGFLLTAIYVWRYWL